MQSLRPDPYRQKAAQRDVSTEDAKKQDHPRRIEERSSQKRREDEGRRWPHAPECVKRAAPVHPAQRPHRKGGSQGDDRHRRSCPGKAQALKHARIVEKGDGVRVTCARLRCDFGVRCDSSDPAVAFAHRGWPRQYADSVRPSFRVAPWIVAIGVALGSPRAGAAPRGAPDASSAPAPAAGGQTFVPADVVHRLKSGDDAAIKDALDEVRLAGKAGAAAAPVIVELLRAGLSPTLTQAALETLGDTESTAASEVVAGYARHRNVVLRRAAVEALAKTRGTWASRALRTALSDSDPTVRGLSATALGDLKVREAIPDLFAALDRDVAEAAASIGELCTGHECEQLVAKLGSLPFDVVTSGLDELLLRPPSEISDGTKLTIVGRIRELGTAEANHFLKGLQAKWPQKSSRHVKQAIDQAVLATEGSPGADGRETAP